MAVSVPTGRVNLVIKNPSTQNDFETSVSLDQRVIDLKKHIYQEYPGNPEVGRQKLIFFGRLLQDEAVLYDTFSNRISEGNSPQTVHLVISRMKDLPPQHSHIPQPQVQRPHAQQFVNRPQQRELPPQNRDFPPGDVPVPQQQEAEGGGRQALLIKLGILVFILQQGGSSMRTLVLVIGAFLLYLYLTGRFRIQFRQYNPRPIRRNRHFTDVDEELRDIHPDHPHEDENVNRGFVGEISDLVFPFIHSLAPTWDPYELVDHPEERPNIPEEAPPQAGPF